MFPAIPVPMYIIALLIAPVNLPPPGMVQRYSWPCSQPYMSLYIYNSHSYSTCQLTSTWYGTKIQLARFPAKPVPMFIIAILIAPVNLPPPGMVQRYSWPGSQPYLSLCIYNSHSYSTCQLTSTWYGTKIQLARFPAKPVPMYIIDFLIAPVNLPPPGMVQRYSWPGSQPYLSLCIYNSHSYSTCQLTSTWYGTKIQLARFPAKPVPMYIIANLIAPVNLPPPGMVQRYSWPCSQPYLSLCI